MDDSQELPCFGASRKAARLSSGPKTLSPDLAVGSLYELTSILVCHVGVVPSLGVSVVSGKLKRARICPPRSYRSRNSAATAVRVSQRYCTLSWLRHTGYNLPAFISSLTATLTSLNQSQYNSAYP